MSSVILFGGGGFIGRNLSRALLDKGHQVTIFERPNVRQFSPAVPSDKMNWIEGDFQNIQDVQDALVGQDFAFHLVGSTLPASSNDNPVYDVESNIVSTIRFLEAARLSKVKRIIYLSSGGTVYGRPLAVPISEDHPTNPISSYGIAKLTSEKYLELFHHLYACRYLVFRLSNPYGRYQRVTALQGAVAVFLSRAILRRPIEIWGDGSVVRDYIFIDDVVSALVASLEYEGSETVFNLGSGAGTSLSELVDEISRLLGSRVRVEYRPGRRLDVPVNILQISKIMREFQWRPTVPLRDGLKLTHDFLTETYSEWSHLPLD